MGTARMMTMAVVAIGAGAFLAMSTIPAFAPYQKHKPDRVPLVAVPEAGDEQVPGAVYGLAPPRSQNSSGDEFGVDLRGGDLVVHLPRWAEDGGEWLTLGRKAWQDWVEPGERASDDRDEPSERYAAPSRRGWDERGYASHRAWNQRREQGARDDEADENGYGPHNSWSNSGEQDLGPLIEAQPSPPDAAASAAQRAREAAREVRAAEGND
jgi:hypothetical protein